MRIRKDPISKQNAIVVKNAYWSLDRLTSIWKFEQRWTKAFNVALSMQRELFDVMAESHLELNERLWEASKE